jgi:putative transposase
MMAGTYCNLLYHVLFSTKGRRPLISSAMKSRLHDYIGGIVRGEDGDLLEINSVADHVHLLVRLHPTQAVADVVRIIKSNSSRWANEKFRSAPSFAWQEGYTAFTVSQSQVARLLAYIRGQEEHHRKRDFRHELVALLRRNGIGFEERYLL